MAEADPELSILMPCLNESRTLPVCISKALAFFRDHGINGEVLIADNGSTDDSRSVAEQHGARVIAVAERGYGAALKAGIASARGTYVIMGDADDSYNFADLEPFIIRLRENYDLVMGNRFKGGIQDGAMPFLHKYLGNPVLSAIGRIMYNVKVGDFHCGLRGFNRQKIMALNLTTDGMEFASEMVVKATINHLRITEVPTTLSVDGRDREPHLRTWRDGWRHLRFLLMLSPRWLFLYPGLLLMLAGIAIIAGIETALPLARRLGLGPQTMLYGGAAIILGHLLLGMSLVARTLGSRFGVLKEKPHLEKLWRSFTVERGIALGFCLMILGLYFAFRSLDHWASLNYSAQNLEETIGTVVYAIIFIVTGAQSVALSFYFNVIDFYSKK